MKITKKDFRENTCLNKIWNKIIMWQGYNLATVMWDQNPWKIVHNDITFNQLTNTVETIDKNSYFKIPYLKNTYTPIAEFHTQEELWQHIKRINDQR